MTNTKTTRTYTTELVSSVVSNYNVYQFYYNSPHARPGSVWPATYLLLKHTMDDHMLEVFQHPAVAQTVSGAYAMDGIGLHSYDVPAKWKGISLGMVLCCRGYKLLKDGDTDTAMVLLEAGDWLGIGNSFHTLARRPLIMTDGSLNLFLEP